MKLNNGKNIITDTDITMTDAKNIGHSLSDVINKLEKDIARLNSNVKWIYKYGGVGSGGHGGGGDSGESSDKLWNFRVSINDITYDTLKINLSKPDVYTLGIKFYKVLGRTFNISITYDSAQGLKRLNLVVTPDMPPSVSQKIDLQVNGTLTIVIEDDEGNYKNYQLDYIVLAYSFTMTYVKYKKETDEYIPFQSSDYNIFIGDFISNEGKLLSELMIDFHYIISVDVTSFSLDYKDWSGKMDTLTSDNTDLLKKPAGHIYLPTGIGAFSNLKAGNYNFTIDPHLILKSSDKEEVIPQYKLLDNLIPSTIYLKVESDGTIYNSDLVSNPASFFTGVIVFRVTPFLGALDLNQPYSLRVVLNENYPGVLLREYIYDLMDLKELLIEIITDKIEWNSITFYYDRKSEYKKDIYYFYAESPLGDFKWYPSQKFESDASSVITIPSLGYLYVYGNPGFLDSKGRIKHFPKLSMDRVIDKKVLDPESIIDVDYTVDESNTYSDYDCMVSIGLSYHKINKHITKPIIQILGNNSACNLNIYQNRLTIGNKDDLKLNIYVPKDNEYHLLTIYKRAVGKTGTAKLYEYAVYIDGVLEKTTVEFIQTPDFYHRILLLKGLYKVNALEISYFKHNAIEDDSLNNFEKFNKNPNKYHLDYLNDLGILYYYYSYKLATKLLISEEFKKAYSIASQFYYDRFRDRVIVNDLIIRTVSNDLDIPVLELEYTEPKMAEDSSIKSDGEAIFKWMEKSYEITKYPNILNEGYIVNVKWSANKSGLNSIQLNSNTYFKLYLQGTSTLLYQNKNFDLALEHSEDPNNEYFYTPNFDPNDPKTFLPEKRFTLKADIVDSSHSNNNAIGKFINTITTKFRGAALEQSGYSEYIKNTLEGFPVLIFFKNRYYPDATHDLPNEDTYFLGIYNFNLGRDSEFNLGYKDLNLLKGRIKGAGFLIITVPTTEHVEAYRSGFGVAEVMENKNYFDFSQSDASVLFLFNNDENDSGLMFGKMKSSNINIFKNSIQTMVEDVSKASGYIFDTLGKNMRDDNPKYMGGYIEGYKSETPLNLVPNYRIPYKRVIRDSNNTLERILGPNKDPGTIGDLIRTLVGILLGEDGAYENPVIDYRAVSEYYVCCMALGLVDSVMKNLNLKTWNNKTFYPSFYDMDTALGKDNAGNDTHYMAFSDFWKALVSIVGSTKYLKSALSYKDWYDPKEETVSGDEDRDPKIGYDIPMTYLLALAKYGYYIFVNSDNLFLKTILRDWYPSNLWARMRRKDKLILWHDGLPPEQMNINHIGCLENSHCFIKNFFAKHLSQVPDVFFNLNYRKKYFVIDNIKSKGYRTGDEVKFSGRRIHYVEDWLNGRLHVLDLYFNLASVIDKVKVCDPKSGIWSDKGDKIYYALPDTLYVDYSNPDILVLLDIFHEVNSNLKFSIDVDLIFKAEDNSPLSFTGNSYGERLLVPETPPTEDLAKYRLLVDSSGKTINLGGSGNWTWIDRIDTLILSNGTLYVHSDKLDTLNGSSGSCLFWDLDLPAVETINLNGKRYTGTLDIQGDSKWPNIRKVNIDGSKMGITLSNVNISELQANDVNTSSNLIVSNCRRLGIISLKNSKFGTINIKTSAPGIFYCAKKWKKIGTDDKAHWERTNEDANSPKCRVLILDNINGGESALFIENMEELEELTITAFTKVYVHGCPNLKVVDIKHPEKLLELDITNSGNNIYGLKINSTNIDKFVNLSSCIKLKHLNLDSTKGFDTVHVGSPVELVPNSFRWTGIKYLKSVNGSLIKLSELAFLTTPYTLLEEPVKKGEAKVLTTFNKTEIRTPGDLHNVFSYCNIDLDTFNLFNTQYKSLLKTIKNASNMWEHNPCAKYTKLMYEEDLLQGKCRINLSAYPNVTNGNRMFSCSGSDCIHPDIFNGFGSSTGVSIHDFMGWGNNNNIPIYVPINWLTHIASKATDINQDKDNLIFTVLEVNSLELKKIFRIKEFFPTSLKKIDSLKNWNFDKEHTINLIGDIKYIEDSKIITYPFLEYTNLNTIYKCFCKCNGINLSTDDYGFLYNLGAIRNISGSFGFLNKPSINLSHFMNWNKLPPNGLFQYILYWDELNNVGNMNKTINSINSFNTIYLNVMATTNAKSVAHLFQNAVVDVSNSGTIKLVPKRGDSSIINTNINSLPYLFDNLVFKNNIGLVYINWDWTMMKYLPNISEVRATFRNNRFSNAIPFNMFYKRIQDLPVPVYIYKDDEEKKALLYKHSYRLDITDMRECFKGCCFGDGAHTFMKENNDLSGVNDKDKVIYTEFDLEYEYAIYHKEPGWEDIKVKNPDYDDMLRETEYTASINDVLLNIAEKGTDEVYNNFGRFDSENTDRPFISPDIFYGCRELVDVSECFADSGLLGFIPDNLFSKCLLANIKSFARDVLIFPKVYKTEIKNLKGSILEYKFMDNDELLELHLSYYLGHGFIKTSNLDYAFDFRIGLPGNNLLEGDRTIGCSLHILAFKDSFGKNTSSCINAFPKRINGTKNFDLIFNVKHFKHYHYLTLMYDSSKELISILNPKVIKLGSLGFNLTYYNLLSANNLYNELFILFAYGNLFDENTALENIRTIKTDNSSYIIKVGNNTYNPITINTETYDGLQAEQFGVSALSRWPAANKSKLKAISVSGIRWNENGDKIESGTAYKTILKKSLIISFDPIYTLKSYLGSYITGSWGFTFED